MRRLTHHTDSLAIQIGAKMSEIEEKPKRKSVAFSEGTTIVDGNGEVTEMNGAGGDKETAQSHGTSDPAVDEVTVGRINTRMTAIAQID